MVKLGEKLLVKLNIVLAVLLLLSSGLNVVTVVKLEKIYKNDAQISPIPIQPKNPNEKKGKKDLSPINIFDPISNQS